MVDILDIYKYICNMGKTIKFTEEQTKEIIRLYVEEKLGTPSIGQLYNVHKAVINRVLRENNIKLDQSGRRNTGGKIAAGKRYRTKHKEKLDLYHQEWSKLNRTKLREYHAEWRDGNEDYKEKHHQYNSKRTNEIPKVKLCKRTRTAVYTCLKERNINKYKSTFKILGYTLDELMIHLEKQFTDGMNWDNYGEWHVDHRIPMTKFNFTSIDDNEFKLCWSLENLRPLWATTREIDGVIYEGNLNKGTKYESKSDNLEIDFYLNKWNINNNIKIEYNDNLTHTEYFGGKDRNYHLNKTLEANNKGYKLIQIFSDEWKNKKELVINKLAHILGKSESIKIGARKCIIKEISKEIKNEFLEQYHIQGKDHSTIKLGAYYNDILVGIMTFKILENKDYDLTRFATNYNYNISGLGSKLLSHFIKNYNPNSIISFADRRWTLDKDNNLYTKLGFKLVNILRPNYRYYHKNNHEEEREHKFGFRKKILVKKYPNMVDLTMTETEMIKELGYDRIWDCGLFKYELSLK